MPAVTEIKEAKKTLLRRFNRWWANTPPWICRLIILGVIAAIGLGLAKPSYKLFRKWMIEQNFRDAIAASAANDPVKARDLALAVLITGDNRIEMFRTLERAMHELGDPRYPRFANALCGHPECTDEDRLNVFKSVTETYPFGLMLAQWAMLPPEQQNGPQFLLALADRAIRDGDHAQVPSILSKINSDTLIPEVAARRIRAKIAENTTEGIEQAQTDLVTMWKLHPDEPVDWCDILESIPIDQFDQFILGPLRPWLIKGRPNQPGRSQLIDARIRFAATTDEKEREKLVDETIKEWKNDAPEKTCEFLEATDRHDRLLATFSDSDVAGKPNLLMKRIKAAVKLKRNPELLATLELHGTTLEPIDFLAYSSVAAFRANDGAKLNMDWKKAIDEGLTSQRPNALVDLYRIATDNGMLLEQERALLAAIRAGRGPLPSYYAITPALELFTNKGMEHELKEILNQYMTFEPWNPLVISRHAYLAAMMGLDKPAEVIDRVSKLVEQSPEETQHAAVLATVQLINGQAADALATWQKISTPIEDLTQAFRVAHLTTRVITEKIDVPTSPDVAAIPWASLMPCERKQFRKLLKLSDEPSQYLDQTNPTTSPGDDPDNLEYRGNTNGDPVSPDLD